MSSEPILVIKDTDSSIGIRARLGDDYSEHEIQLNVMLAYYWDNDLPVIENLVDLFETVVKRTINEVIPHKNLYLKYNLITDDELKNASRFEIHLLEVKADELSLRLDGKILALKGLSSKEEYAKGALIDKGEVKDIEKEKEDNLILNDSPSVMSLIEKNIPTEEKLSFKEFVKKQQELNKNQ
ncbi:hypothetical protein [uncultured Methanobrevibacter sp.]|uniref:hypothetical protein n=1 Tax=uncultured Methanobrevibacter sp. TaxID=253161 RepID=UPI0026036C22